LINGFYSIVFLMNLKEVFVCQVNLIYVGDKGTGKGSSTPQVSKRLRGGIKKEHPTRGYYKESPFDLTLFEEKPGPQY
jgi:hypothetical protein